MQNFIFKKKSLKMTSLFIVFDAGARLETDGKHGTMHLMEHLVCKTFKDLYENLTKLGIEWNAYTSTECVVVYFSGLDKYLTNELKKELYLRITGGIDCVDENEFECERNVVLQEYMDNVFDSERASWMQVMRRWWGDYMAIGKQSDIESFTHSDMLKVYGERFARPSRIVEVGRTKTDFFNTVDFKETEPNTSILKFKRRKGFPDVGVASDDKTSVFLFSKRRVSARDYPYLSVGLEMLSSGLESPFYKELREKLGLTYYVLGDVLCSHDQGVMYVNACTDADNTEKLKAKIAELADNVKSYMTEERFDTVISKLKIQREMDEAVLYKNPWRYVSTSKMMMPSSFKRITYKKVLETTLKYFSDTALVTIDD